MLLNKKTAILVYYYALELPITQSAGRATARRFNARGSAAPPPLASYLFGIGYRPRSLPEIARAEQDHAKMSRRNRLYPMSSSLQQEPTMPHDGPIAHDAENYVRPGEPGHNVSGGEVVWERWQKKRIFVRALEGTYGELVRELFSQPRVYHAKDWKWKGGPQLYGKTVIHPGAVKIAQSIECHLNTFSPHGAAPTDI
jgi:hypothetical protein